MSEVTQITTEMLTLKKISTRNLAFLIPSYQRPYVWSGDDVTTLFTDIKNACDNNEENYFIGSGLSAIRFDGKREKYELIDGQQRVTTLMLMAIAFKAAGVKSALSDMALLGNQSRLGFEIRDSVKNLLGSYAGLDAEYATRSSDSEIDNDPYLKPLAVNLQVLKGLVKGLKDKKEELADYIYTKVQWINNVVPVKMDLNRMFHSMNTAGIQLQPVDLLKARLLKRINSDKRLYSTIWQVCEYLENYFERNVRDSFEAADKDWSAITYADLSCVNSKLTVKDEKGFREVGGETSGKTLADLLSSDAKEELLKNSDQSKQDEEDPNKVVVYCRSIISFDLLLIHTLRIFHAQRGWADIEPRIKAGNLLACFKKLLEEDEPTIKSFIELLWKVRYQFDTWIMKWVEYDDAQGEQLRLTNLSHSDGRINRAHKSLSGLVQLQAVRYFTGDRSAQYWLTPLLSKLVKHNLSSIADYEPQVLAWLEESDNQLSLTTETQKEASFKMALDQIPTLQQWSEREAYFGESRGTGFEHYWFQKLEYLLWKAGNGSDSKVAKYRVTSKNSIEHVRAQHDEHGVKLDDEYLHAFGNLVLLSPGENSSYSNKEVRVKKAEFIGHAKYSDKYQSLKLKAIFDLCGDEDWTVDKIKTHQGKMIEVLREHYPPLHDRSKPVAPIVRLHALTMFANQ